MDDEFEDWCRIMGFEERPDNVYALTDVYILWRNAVVCCEPPGEDEC